MLFVNDPTWKPDFPAVLSDDQWDRLARPSGLPLEARYNIDKIIGLYRQQVTGAKARHSSVCEKLQVARDAAAEALGRLNEVISDSITFAAIATGIDGQRELSPRKLGAFQRWLKQKRNELNALVKGYDNAIERVHNRKRGPKTGHDSLLTLVALLNDLHKAYTGKRISRSGNKTNTSIEFVRDVCRLADSNLKESTVEEAVKHIITDDLQDEYHGVGSEELIPHKEEQELPEFPELHIEMNCSWMPIFLPVPGHCKINISKTAPCENGIRWRVVSAGE
jgi:hypothetical protein